MKKILAILLVFSCLLGCAGAGAEATESELSHKNQLLNRTLEFLNLQGWSYEYSSKTGLIQFTMNLDSQLGSCRVYVLPDDTEIECVATCPIKASPDVYDDVVEFITRANYNNLIGNFEFDYDDGEIRYRYCMLCDETIPSLYDVARCICLSYKMFEQYGDALVKTLMGYGDPEADIKAIRG